MGQTFAFGGTSLLIVVGWPRKRLGRDRAEAHKRREIPTPS
jgi:hypothetical protein